MTDPFANLLDSFKQGTTQNKEKSTESTAQSTTQSLNTSLNTPLIPSKSTTPLQSDVVRQQDDLDQLFNNSNNNTVSNTVKNNEDWDKAFDIFNNNATSNDNNNTTNNIDNDPTPHDDDADDVVDEVKDMEIAQIMSLGFTFDQSLNYYNKGLSYDTLLKRQNVKKHLSQRHIDLDRNNINDNFNLDRNTMPKDGPSMGETLMDSAWNVFNKSKKLVDSWTQFDPNENNRLNHRNDEFQQPLEDYEDEAFEQDFTTQLNLEPSQQVQKEEDNNLLDFEDTSATVDTPPPSAPTHSTLLDFDQPLTSSVTKTQSRTVKSNISDIELLSYNEFKDNATQLFKNGHYAEALEQYTKSLNTLPQSHPLRLIAISNMMISQLKIGEYNNIIKLNDGCNDLYPANENDWNDIIPNSKPNRTFKDIWSKIMLRRAEAFEHLENYKLALKTYQDMLDKNLTNSKVLEGKRRCEKVINPEKFKPTSTPLLPSQQKQQKKKEPLQNTENVNRIKQINANLEKEADLKVKLYDQVELKINNWKSDKSDNIRYLLSNLHTILTWTNWNPISQTDLVMPKKVKINYMKAVAKCHPDKIPSTLDLENKMIAENVFAILSDAWEKFKIENNMA